MTPHVALQILASVAGRPMSIGEQHAAQQAIHVLEAVLAAKPQAATAEASQASSRGV